MGGRGASTGVSDKGKKYGTEYREKCGTEYGASPDGGRRETDRSDGK